MVVTVDATGTANIGTSSVSSFNYTGITVGTSASALVCSVALGITTETGITATWNGVSMSPLGSISPAGTAADGIVAFFGLRNPQSGNQTLALNWTGASFPTVEAISFVGSDTTSIANAFRNVASTSGSGTGTFTNSFPSGSTGSIVLVGWGASGLSVGPNQTQVYYDTSSSGLDSALARATGTGGAISFTAGNGSTTPWASIGIEIWPASYNFMFLNSGKQANSFIFVT